MRLSTGIYCIKNGQTRSAMPKIWRWHSGGAAVKEESKQWVARKGSEFEIKDYHVPVSEASQTPSPNNYFSKTWETHKTPFTAHTSTNTSSVFQNHDRSTSPHRDWQYASHSTQTLPQESFVIASFNILASEHAYAHRSLYSSVPTYLLAWSRRKQKVLNHLHSCSPDIICLQEVDQFKDLEEDLAVRGYAGLYKGRTGEMPDGCAIFWRKKRFQLLQERSFEFAMLGMRNNVAQLCVLQLIGPRLTKNKSCSSVFRSEGQTQSHHLVVGNIHVLFNPKCGEVKLGQCRAFLEQVHNMSSIWHGAPVVIGGDFNSTPCSAVYKYLATSELELSNLDRRYLSGLVPEVRSMNAQKSRNKVPSSGQLKETVVEFSTVELASQKKADEAVSCLSDIPVSSAKSTYASLVEIDSYESLGSNLEDGNGKIMAMEQDWGSREQTSGLRRLKEAAENSDTSIRCMLESFEEAHSIDSTYVDKTHDSIGTEASGAQTNSLPISMSCVSQECTPSNHVQACCDSSINSSTEEHREDGQDKYVWNWEELRMATGKPDCTLMQHELNLYSAYTDIQGNTNTRDARGEPLVTTCHKDFLGTVDYIWRNDGLKTLRVLETVPVKALAMNKGLPIRIWGSDHLALVCELAFSQHGS